MALKTARFDSVADVRIDETLCNGCGSCVRVCRGAPLVMDGKRVRVDQTIGFGCIACGQCVTVCPTGAIQVTGRDLGPDDVLPFPERAACADYDALRALLSTRRSVRDFTSKDVAPELVERILDAASSAPMGLPPSDVRVLVFQGRAAVRGFRDELAARLRTWRWMTRGVGHALMRPFVSKALATTLRDFMGPVIEAYDQKEREGVDWFFYGAPLALYFHASALADPADPIIAATYAMIAAQSLGLGTTMLGIPGIVVSRAKDLQEKYGVEPGSGPGLVLIVGHPAVRYHRTLRRRFGEVRVIGSEGAA